MSFWKPASVAAALVFSSGVNAALITANFSATVASGEFAGSLATGTFSYDDGLINGVGNEFLDTSHGLTVEVTAFGQTFTDLDDIAKNGTFDELPELAFVDGVASYLDFWVSEVEVVEFNGTEWEFQPNVREINQAGIIGFGAYTLNSIGVNVYDGTFEVETVPVPGSVALLGAGLLGVTLARRRRA